MSVSNRPTHEVFAVTRTSNDPDARAFWTKIGAAWENADSKGFSIKLQFLPLDGSEIMREPKPKDEPRKAAKR